MADQLTAFERYPRGGSDFWDTPAGAIAISEVFEVSTLIPRRAIILMSGQLQEIPTALLGTGKLPIVILSDGTLKERQTVEGTPIVIDSGLLRQLNSTESLEI